MPIPLISDIVPKDDGDFPVVKAQHVGFKDGRLPDYMPVFLTQSEYYALRDAGQLNMNTPYMIIAGDDE